MLEKTEEKSQPWVVLIYQHFSFDFLGLDNVDFENYFASKLINMGRFF